MLSPEWEEWPAVPWLGRKEPAARSSVLIITACPVWSVVLATPWAREAAS